MTWVLVLTAGAEPLPEERACDEGVAAACTEIGHAYLKGEGVPLDRFRAVQLFRRGCDLDDAHACMWLAEAYRTGEGLRLDAIQAVELYDKACRLRDGLACRSVGDLYTMGAVGAADGRSAGGWYLEGCDLGDAQSCSAAALWLERGEGTTADPVAARALLEKACRGGYPRGCTLLGDRHRRPLDDSPKDLDAAYGWYRAGCTAPFDPEACWVYGEALLEGRHVERDVDGALGCLDRACYLNEVRACRVLAQAYASRDRLPEAWMAAQRGCDLGDRAACALSDRVNGKLARTLGE